MSKIEVANVFGAHVLAAQRGLDLTDASCNGATMYDILSPSVRLSAQVDAVTAATQLVTVLIGGNDVGAISTPLGTILPG